MEIESTIKKVRQPVLFDSAIDTHVVNNFNSALIFEDLGWKLGFNNG